jgi:hypothetical protein
MLRAGSAISSGLQMTHHRRSIVGALFPTTSWQPVRDRGQETSPRVAAGGRDPQDGGRSVTQDRDAKHESASELLADWRSAERDSVAAHEAASVAARAVKAAAAAEEAAVGAETAAQEATDAASCAATESRSADRQSASKSDAEPCSASLAFDTLYALRPEGPGLSRSVGTLRILGGELVGRGRLARRANG